DFFRGARVGRALEDDDLTGAQIGRYGVGGVGDVAEVGLVIFVERGGDADDDRIHGGDLRIVGRGFEAVGFGRRDLRGRDADNVGAAVVEGIDFALIDIEPGDGKFLFAVEQGQGQSDVAEADDSNPRLARIDAAFQIGKEGRSGELSIHIKFAHPDVRGRASPSGALESPTIAGQSGRKAGFSSIAESILRRISRTKFALLSASMAPMTRGALVHSRLYA